jgi:hypothetical protein
MAKGSTRALAKIKRGTVENRVEIPWLTAAGVLQGRQQLANVRGKRRRSQWLMTIFLYFGYRIHQRLVFDTVYCN